MRKTRIFTKRGTLCARGHDSGGGYPLRDKTGHCIACDRQRKRELYRADPEVRRKSLIRRAQLRADPEKRAAERAKQRISRNENKERLSARRKELYYKNHERNLLRSRAKHKENLEKSRKKSRESKRKARLEHPEKAREYTHLYYRRNAIRIRIRNRAYKALKSGGRKKLDKLLKLGIDIKAIAAHLGPCPGSDWHVDHIRPLSWFDLSDPAQVCEAFSPANHQWLPAVQNLAKGNRYAGTQIRQNR